MSPIAWSDLRPLHGSQQNAFEELCCQLAAVEQTPAGSRFVRKAPPDAGVECYWRMPDETERAWQAKFFTDPLGPSQWQQIDNSVQKALEKHPNLTRYTICIPRDREDPRRPDQEWFMDKWNSHVTKWEGWAHEHGLTVGFEYWGTSQILLCLSREEHRGRALFWFKTNLFTPSWFRERLDVTIANAGPRYSPALRVDLPIADVFGGFCRTEQFVAAIARARGQFGREGDDAGVDHPVVREGVKALPALRERILSLLEYVDGNPPPLIPFPGVFDAAARMRDNAWQLASLLRDVKRGEEPSTADPDRDRERLARIAHAADAIADLATTEAAIAANARLLILRGEAGKGKTHLLCDIADSRVTQGRPSVVLLGEAFATGEPWKQLTNLLGLDCTVDEFLGALDAAAEVVGGCALIAIDALNESAHRPMWLSHLAGMVELLKRYPRVRLAVSVRSSYEETVIPTQLSASDVVVRVTHQGFAGHEYAATKVFFRYYGITLPSVPLLNPEFENPLFLKLFCEGLRSAGLTEVPKGFHGVSTVFSFFFEATNTKLAREGELGIDVKDGLVQRAIDRIADLMAKRDVRALPRTTAKDAIDEIHTAPQFERTLFRRLLAEGVLAEDRAWTEGGQVDVVRFGYERLADHLIAKRLLDCHVDATDPKAAFAIDGSLGGYLRRNAVFWNTGLFAALAVQLPERFGLELPQALADLAGTDVIRQAVVESIVWRLPTAFSEATRDYIRTEVLPRRQPREHLLNAMLTVAATPNHPYNADRLHKLLLRFPMPDRDRWWSTYLFRHAGEHGAVDRLVDWAREQDGGHIDDDASRLVAMALTWFLTTSHRPLRDDATKGLVALLTPRGIILQQVLTSFREVDDLYVRERLYAVAYGCAMRTTDHSATAQLAQQVYDEVFRSSPPTHLLLRDYARGVVELALARGAALEIDPRKIKPPYGAPWPEMPTEDDVAHYGDRQEGSPDDEWARVIIYRSIMDGDVGRYIIGTNSRTFEWSPDPLHGPRVPRPRERQQAFLANLTSRQRRAYERIREAVMIEVFENPSGSPEGRRRHSGLRARAERSFRNTLGKRKIEEYETWIQPYTGTIHQEPWFDLRMAQRWVLRRVFELGWTVERFGRFDRTETRLGESRRQAGKGERIGKKYQWIAWHEFLALVADNFRFSDRHSGDDEKYEGPWQIFRRDIDPSVLLRKTGRERWGAQSLTWWFPVAFTTWEEPTDDDAWRQLTADLPPIPPLIDVKRPDGTQALVLEMSCQWAQPQPSDADEFEVERRRIFYWLKSYLVRKENLDDMVEWARTHNLHSYRFPEVRHPTQAFLGEFPWAAAVSTQTGSYYSRTGWTTGNDRFPLPHPVLPTNDNYFWEQSGYDCSIDDTFSIEQPCKELIDGMHLAWRGSEGRFYDTGGTLIASDPSVKESGPSALVVARIPIIAFLEQENLAILWIVFGERQVIAPRQGGKNYSELSGVYILREGVVEGDVQAYSPPDPAANEPGDRER